MKGMGDTFGHVETRKKPWDPPERLDPAREENKIVFAKVEIDPNYEDYLTQLAARNKHLRRLRAKDERGVELERKERGFTIYVNGANAEKRRPSRTAPASSQDSDVVDDPRCQTAPERRRERTPFTISVPTPRCKWRCDHEVGIRTQSGKKLRVPASAVNPDEAEGGEREGEEGEEAEEEVREIRSAIKPEENEEEEEEREADSKIGLSLDDLRILRQSLDLELSIKRVMDSFTEEILDDQIDEEIDGYESDFLEESTETLFAPSGSSSLLPDSLVNVVDDEVVFLEFSQSESSARRRSRDLATPRKKTRDSLEPNGVISTLRETLAIHATTTGSLEAIADSVSEKEASSEIQGEPLTLPSLASKPEGSCSLDDLNQFRESFSGGKRRKSVALPVVPSRPATALEKETPSDGHRIEDLLDAINAENETASIARVLAAPASSSSAPDILRDPFSHRSAALAASPSSSDAMDDMRETSASAPLERLEGAVPGRCEVSSTRPSSVGVNSQRLSVEDKLIDSEKTTATTITTSTTASSLPLPSLGTSPPSKDGPKPLPSSSPSSSAADDPLSVEVRKSLEKLSSNATLVRDRVLKMDASQQVVFLKVLERLEKALTPDVEEDDKNDGDDDKDVEAKDEWKESSTATTTMMTTSGEDLNALVTTKIAEEVRQSHKCLSRDPPSPHQSGATISVDLLSAWDDGEEMGLTEIQVFDARGRWIILRSDALSVDGAEKTSGPLGMLVNRHHKTTKDRNMWTTRFSKTCPCPRVQISLDERTSKRGVSRISVWNFNGERLDKCVKDVRIFYQDVLVYEGILEKGSGNQILDYGNDIPVLVANGCGRDENDDDNDKNDDDVSRSATRTLDYVDDGVGNILRPVVEENLVEEKTRQKLVQIVEDITETDPVNAVSPFPPVPSPKSLEKPEKPKLEEKVKKPKSKAKEKSPAKLPAKTRPKKTLMAKKPSPTTKKSWTFGFNLHMSQDPVEEATPETGLADGVESGLNAAQRGAGDDDDDTKEEMEESLFDQLKSLNLKSEQETEDGGDIRTILHPSEPLLESDEESRMIKSWLKEDERIPFDFDEDPKPKTQRPQSWRRTPGLGPETSSSGHVEKIPEVSKDYLNVEEVERTDSISTISMRTFSPLQPSSSELSIDGRGMTPWGKSFDPLESSWNSLNAFQQMHRGQISMEIDGDVVDMMMQTRYRQRETLSPREDPTRDVPISPRVAFPSKVDENIVEPNERVACEFTIPELPVGSFLQINIRSTWGDTHYLGLNGVEIFSSSGDQVEIVDVSADPPDINILPEYHDDPRVVANLFDGVNRTTDDIHMWLCPFTPGEDHVISVQFRQAEEIAMIRFWNYNKSRTYSFRGARFVEVSLDAALIFKGEIARAQGGVIGGTEAFGDTILFTMDEMILERVAENDEAFDAVDEDIPNGLVGPFDMHSEAPPQWPVEARSKK